MRTLFGCVTLSVALILCGCGKEKSGTPSTPPPAAAPAASPSQGTYLGTLVKGQQTAVKGIDTAALNHEVELFQAQEGRFPKDLNELVTKNYIGKLPDPPAGMKLAYDATSGKVTVVPQ